MEPQQVVAQFLKLPADAQRVVADLIAYLDRRQASPAMPAAKVEGATLLPLLDISSAPQAWPENEFADPEFYGMWADREDMRNGGTAYIHEVRRDLRTPR